MRLGCVPRRFDARRALCLSERDGVLKRIAQIAAYALDNPDEIAFGTAASIAAASASRRAPFGPEQTWRSLATPRSGPTKRQAALGDSWFHDAPVTPLPPPGGTWDDSTAVFKRYRNAQLNQVNCFQRLR